MVRLVCMQLRNMQKCVLISNIKRCNKPYVESLAYFQIPLTYRYNNKLFWVFVDRLSWLCISSSNLWEVKKLRNSWRHLQPTCPIIVFLLLFFVGPLYKYKHVLGLGGSFFLRQAFTSFFLGCEEGGRFCLRLRYY